MALYRRKGSPFWWWDLTIEGNRFRGSCQTGDRAEAEIIYAKLRSDALLGRLTGQAPKITLDEAFGRYITEHARHLPSARVIVYVAGAMLKRLGRNVTLDQLDDDCLSRFVARRRGEVSNSTVNRDLQLLRAVMNMARRKWKRDVANVDWRIHRLPEPSGRTRVLSPEEADHLIAAAAPHLRPALACALYTGLRQRNVLGLDWSEVDLRRGVLAVRVKSRRPGGKPLTVPIAPPLLAILANLGPQDRGPVFLFKGRSVAKMRRAFASACRRAGIEGLRWHDLRHTAASWMIEQGVPLDVVQTILGHSDIRLTQRYAHRRQDAQRQAVEAIGRAWAPSGTLASQAPAPRKVKS